MKLRYLKSKQIFESENKLSSMSAPIEDGFRVLRFDNYEDIKKMFDKWYDDAQYVGEDGDFDVYYRDTKSWDKDEEEHWWHTKLAILVDWKGFVLKTKEVHSEAIYSIRNEAEGMTREQEFKIRCRAGTHKKPKQMGTYLGFDTSTKLAYYISNLSKTYWKVDGTGEDTQIEKSEVPNSLI